MVTVINSRQNIQVNTSYSLSCDLIHIEFQLHKLFYILEQHTEIQSMC